MPVRPVLFATGIPTNTYPCTVVLPHPFRKGTFAYRSTEHRFHAMKAWYSAVGDEGLHDLIGKATSWQSAKSLGRTDVTFTDNERVVWDQLAAPTVMLEANLAKFQQNKACRDWLLATGTARLIEHRRDKIWGDGLDGSGRNQMGKILEVVRAVIRG